MAFVDYNITFIPPVGGGGVLIEYRKTTETTWTTPSSPINPTTLNTYPLSLETGYDYWVRVSGQGRNCSPKYKLVSIQTGSTTTTTTTTGTTTTTTSTSTTSSTTTTTTTAAPISCHSYSVQGFSGDGFVEWEDCETGEPQSATIGNSVLTVCSRSYPTGTHINITDLGNC